MSLILSYNINLNTQETEGDNFFNEKEQEVNFLLRSNNNSITSCKSVKLSYKLTINQTITVSMSSLGTKFLKTICLKASSSVNYAYSTQQLTCTNLFIDNTIPTTIPTVVDSNSITVTNRNNQPNDITLFLVYLI